MARATANERKNGECLVRVHTLLRNRAADARKGREREREREDTRERANKREKERERGVADGVSREDVTRYA